MQYKILSTKYNDIKFIKLKSNFIEAVVTNLGCAIVSLKTKNKNGIFTENVLGFNDIDTYIKQDKYIGVVVGRCANRIAKGEFELNGEKYKLYKNNGSNHLHGGKEGFDKKIFDFNINENSIIFSYTSENGEEGYPSRLDFTVEYAVSQNAFTVKYSGISDGTTVLNPTNHSYFNLSGGKTNILNHKLMISADKFGKIDNEGLVTGEIQDVKNTAFDFNSSKKIADCIYKSDEQLKLGNGYDHPFILKKNVNPQIELNDEGSGKFLRINTTMPCVQLYTANYLDGTLLGAHKTPLNKHFGICLETSFFPNAINNQFRNDVVLKCGERFSSTTQYIFGNI